MRAFVCIDIRDWEAVVRGVARYLSEGEATLAHVVDERAFRGYGLALRGLLGRRGRRSEEGMLSTSQAAAEELLTEATTLLEQLRPGLAIKTAALSGPPNEELIRAAEGAEIIFVGRGAPGARPQVKISGVVRGWRRNHPGDFDGFYLDDGVEVRFPPHKASDVRNAIREGTPVDVSGVWHTRHLHAYSITNTDSKVSVEAHKPHGEGPGRSPLGHTARFVVDHALCDVVVLYL